MTQPSSVRIGFIGAGSIARTRHLPGLARISAVQVVAVCNRTQESSRTVARDFSIPHVVEKWADLVHRPDIDAVFIGTWPNTHRELSVAALQAGKHVFCQARMALDLAEGKAMLAASQAHPNLVAHVCPPPTRMPFEPFVCDLLASGRLGDLVSVELVSRGGANLRLDAVHWRERREISGNQVMAMGIYAETLNAWVGPYDDLSARTAVPVPAKRDETGKSIQIKVPQAVTITGRLKNGALCVEHHLGLAADTTTPGDRLTIWGRKGTLRYGFGGTIELAQAGEELKPVSVPAGLQRDWHVEEDFIAAVRATGAGGPTKTGKKIGINPDFAEALEYMRKVEAVHLSAATGRAVKPAEL